MSRLDNIIHQVNLLTDSLSIIEVVPHITVEPTKELDFNFSAKTIEAVGCYQFILKNGYSVNVLWRYNTDSDNRFKLYEDQLSFDDIQYIQALGFRYSKPNDPQNEYVYNEYFDFEFMPLITIQELVDYIVKVAQLKD